MGSQERLPLLVRCVCVVKEQIYNTKLAPPFGRGGAFLMLNNKDDSITSNVRRIWWKKYLL